MIRHITIVFHINSSANIMLFFKTQTKYEKKKSHFLQHQTVLPINHHSFIIYFINCILYYFVECVILTKVPKKFSWTHHPNIWHAIKATVKIRLFVMMEVWHISSSSISIIFSFTSAVMKKYGRPCGELTQNSAMPARHSFWRLTCFFPSSAK